MRVTLTKIFDTEKEPIGDIKNVSYGKNTEDNE